MSLPEVGKSLDPGSTLQAKSRQAIRVGQTCKDCKLPSFPRGYCTNLGTCWYCTFKR